MQHIRLIIFTTLQSDPFVLGSLSTSSTGRRALSLSQRRPRPVLSSPNPFSNNNKNSNNNITPSTFSLNLNILITAQPTTAALSRKQRFLRERFFREPLDNEVSNPEGLLMWAQQQLGIYEGDMVDSDTVKTHFRRALLRYHPDKARQRDASSDMLPELESASRSSSRSSLASDGSAAESRMTKFDGEPTRMVGCKNHNVSPHAVHD